MDTLKLREDRIGMVKGMQELINGIVDPKKKEQAIKSVFA